MSTELAHNIITFSKQKNLSIRQLEEKAGLYGGYVRKLKAGLINNVNIAKLTKIARILDVPLDALVGSVIPTHTEDKVISFNQTLHEDVHKFINNYLSTHKIKDFSLTIYNVASEIYLYSLENNNAVLDKNFADFLIKKYLEETH
ncbi:MAG: helix-turn-helix transcriptional regulator [Rickettsiales bacterium]